MTTVPLSEAIERYLDGRAAAGLAHNTVRKEQATLSALLSACNDLPLSEIQPGHIDALREARSASCGPSTMNVERNNLIQFFKWAKARGLYPLASDPLADWRLAKTPRRDWLRIPEEKFGEVLDAAEHPADRFVIALELFLFVRESEVKVMKVSDARLNERAMTVTREKTKQRVSLPWDPEFDKELRSWLTYAQLGPNDFLACAKDAMGNLRKNRPVGKPAAAVRRALLKVGYTEKQLEREGSHTLRRSAATAWYRKLVEEGGYVHAGRMVQLRLGHSTFAQTERYLGLEYENWVTEQLLGPEAGPMFSTRPKLSEGVIDLASRRQA